MRLLISLVLTFSTLQLLCQSYIIKDVHIIPIESKDVYTKQSVLIEDGIIKEIGKFKTIKNRKNVTIIQGKGKYLMPSLADMHVHLKADTLVENQLTQYLSAGVTHIRIMDSKSDQQQIKSKVISHAYDYAPNIFYSKIIKREESYNDSQADSLMAKVKQEGYDFIKLYGLSNENTFHNIMNSANKNQIIVCGHYPIYRQFGKGVMVNMDTVLALNFKSIEHLGGYTNYEEDSFDALVKYTKVNGIYNCPTLDWDIMAYDLQFPEAYKNRITYSFLPKPMIDKWEAEYAQAIEKAGGQSKIIESRDKYQATFVKKLKLIKLLYDHQCLLLLGGDAGNTFQADGFNMYEEMMHWHNAGIDNHTILMSATLNAAKFFNQEDTWGTVATGRKAELILLEKNPLDDIRNITSIQYTFSNGKLYDNQKLKMLLK